MVHVPLYHSESADELGQEGRRWRVHLGTIIVGPSIPPRNLS